MRRVFACTLIYPFIRTGDHLGREKSDGFMGRSRESLEGFVIHGREFFVHRRILCCRPASVNETVPCFPDFLHAVESYVPVSALEHPNEGVIGHRIRNDRLGLCQIAVDDPSPLLAGKICHRRVPCSVYRVFSCLNIRFLSYVSEVSSATTASGNGSSTSSGSLAQLPPSGRSTRLAGSGWEMESGTSRPLYIFSFCVHPASSATDRAATAATVILDIFIYSKISCFVLCTLLRSNIQTDKLFSRSHLYNICRVHNTVFSCTVKQGF